MMFAILAVSGCVTDVQNQGEQAELAPRETADRVVTLDEDVNLALALGMSVRTLKAGSTWRDAGRLPQGRAYRAEGDVLTIHAFYNHEAYVIVHDGQCVGLYVPVQRTFIKVHNAVPFRLRSTP